MSGKHTKKKTSPGKSALLAFILVLLTVAVVVLAVWRGGASSPSAPPAASPSPTPQTEPATEATPTPDTTPAPTPTHQAQAEIEPVTTINLGNGLEITDMGSYTGTYMEDGSDEFVTGVMMIIVANTGDADLQFASIELAFADTTANFELSNLAVGQSVVLLEKQRQPQPQGQPMSAVARNVVLFDSPMSLCTELVEITGLDGMLNVKNISGADITGDIVVYYKNSATDLLYGGITYRVRIEGGLAAGEIRQVVAGHYRSSGSSICMVTVG